MLLLDVLADGYALDISRLDLPAYGEDEYPAADDYAGGDYYAS